MLEPALAQLDLETLDPQVALELTGKFSRLERMGAAGKALCGNRVAESNAWYETGERSPAHWVAWESKCTVGHAHKVLQTAELIGGLESTQAAFRRGALSERQAFDIADAAGADPQAEAELLALAEHESLRRLRRRCAQVKAAAGSPEETHRRIWENRYLRHYTDLEGAFCLEGRMTTSDGAKVLAALEPVRQQLFNRYRKEPLGKVRPDAVLADAPVELASQAGQTPEDAFRPNPSAVVHVRVDHSALVRGEIAPGEICEVPGVGPIPVSAARAFASDAFLCALATDGKDVTAVSHLGRTIPAHLRTALMERDPRCVVPGCTHEGPLEIDHIKPVAEGGPTELNNLARLCRWHHYKKTYRGYRLKRVAGGWTWSTRDGPPPDPEAAQPELVFS
ncbi:MAG: HNH endonuclease [Actinobacteria bacterium]|nr:HNH endonuclease [Actinomycetota bacterium]